ncbi:MAG: hypothetical protein R3C49_23650 [Planctomycetaceae bacterium]
MADRFVDRQLSGSNPKCRLVRGDDESGAVATNGRNRDWRAAPAVCVFGLMFVLQVTFGMFAFGSSQLRLERKSLPDQLSHWKKVDFKTRQRDPGDLRGEISCIWLYGDKDGEQVTVTVSQPFDSWVDGGRIHKRSGGIEQNRCVVTGAGDAEQPLIHMDLTMVDGSQGCSVFTTLIPAGTKTEMPKSGRTDAGDVVRTTIGSAFAGPVRQTSFVEVLATGPKTISDDFRLQLVDLMRLVISSLPSEQR